MSPERVRLTVEAGSPLAEVFVIDHAFALVKRSIGDLECEVEPGVYKVKAKLGDATFERLVLLEADETLDVANDLRSGTAVPLGGTKRGRAAGVGDAVQASRHVGSKSGDGAQIFVMTQGLAGDGEEGPVSAPEASLHRPDGTRVGELRPLAGEGARGTTIEVDPGPYLLCRSGSEGDTLEQFIHAVAGWQTQVFAVEEPGPSLDLWRTRVSVLMAREGFDPDDDELRLVEEARTALADERNVASERLGELFEASSNPMLGLFGAHLMLLARDEQRRTSERSSPEASPAAPVRFDQDRFDRIVDALRDVLGAGHPDAVALATQRTGQSLEALEPVAAPPMLWRSWVLLVEASNDAPQLVPVSTWERTLHVLPLRPFFIWQAAEDVPRARASWVDSVTRTLEASARTPGRPGGAAALSLETDAEAAEPEPPRAGDAERSHLSRQLLVPRAAIDRLADGEGL